MNANGVITSVEDKDAAIKEGTATLEKGKTITKIGGIDHYIRSSTVFFFYETETVDDATVVKNYGVTVGYRDVQTVSESKTVSYVADDNQALAVVAVPVGHTAASSDEVYAYVYDKTPTQTLENGAIVYNYNVFMNGEATTVKMKTEAVDKVGVYKAVETSGFYALEAVTPVADKTVSIVESTYFVAGGKLYNILSGTEIYAATKNLDGAIIKLEAADLELVFGKTLKVDVVAKDDNAQYVIFWYE